MQKSKKVLICLTAIMAALLSGCVHYPTETIVLKDQGSLTFAGTALQYPGQFDSENFLSPKGQKAYGDHGYAFYQIPQNAKPYPVIFQHGGAQTKRTWESTPDGRDGFQNLFLKAGFAVWLVDQPRMGEAGLSTQPDQGNNPWATSPLYLDKALFNLSRVGDESGVYEGSQFPDTEEAVEAFQRSWNPYSGELDNDLNARALAELFEKTGPGILVTHSMGGTIGWRTPFYTDNIKAIIAYEPGGTPFVFPKGKAPKAEVPVFAPLSASTLEVSQENFEKLTRIPIILFYGDYIASEPVKDVGQDKWRSELDMAKKFVRAVNEAGGNATLIHLPEIGIRGNSHFLMAEKNNVELFNLALNFLKENGLD